MPYRLIASVVSVAVATRCQPQTTALSDEQRTQCRAQGGAVRNDEAGNSICVPSLPGAGHTCSNASQCSSACRVQPYEALGQCMAHPVIDSCGLDTLDIEGVLRQGICI